MRIRDLGLILSVTGVVTLAADTACAEETVRVFLVAGQSNAEGADTHASEVDDFPPFVGAGAPQPDVRYWYENGAAPFSSNGWIPLQPETQRQILGPEITFGHAVKNASAGPIAIIKSTRGGTNLAVDWDPDAASGALMYARTITLVETALAELTKEGIPWTLEAVLWHQGENDMLNNTYVQQYRKNLLELMARFRTDLNAPDLPFFVGATSDKCIWGMDFRDNMQVLRAQQLAAVAQDPHATFVPASHLAFRLDIGQAAPHYHFGTEGQLQLGEAYADAYLNSIGVDVAHASEKFCCGFPAEPGEDVRVFIFAGQRSMEGEGAYASQIADHPEYAALNTPQHDVLYRYRLGGGEHVSTDWAPLGPADYLTNFGPELSFGRAVDCASGDPVAIIKVVHSAAVARDWLPNPSDASLPQYDDSIAFIQAALADLKQRGMNPQLEAVVWTPGEHDAWWPPFRNEYAENLEAIVNAMRADLDAADLRWIIAELPDALVWETDRLDALDNEIRTVANADPNVWFVRSNHIPVPPQSPTVGTEGGLVLGERLAEFYLDLEPCPGDLDGDNVVDAPDLATLLGAWGGDCTPADLDGDGVGPSDLATLLAAWGPCD